MSLTKAWIPYILVAIILVITRVSPEVKAFVSSLSFFIQKYFRRD